MQQALQAELAMTWLLAVHLKAFRKFLKDNLVSAPMPSESATNLVQYKRNTITAKGILKKVSLAFPPYIILLYLPSLSFFSIIHLIIHRCGRVQLVQDVQHTNCVDYLT